tara:strand:+ start:22 stop:504 length:483 start_codon:yes stop_codon:yes gene_type:complete
MSNLLVQNIKHTNGTTAATVDSVGRMQLPQLPHFHGNRLGLSIEERLANVNYNVVRDNYSGWNSSNHQYTIPVTGVYLFNFHNIGSSNTSTNVQYNKLQFVRSGSSTDIAWAYQSNDSLHEQIAMSATYHLQANDLVQILNSSGTVYSSYYNTFSICFMG